MLLYRKLVKYLNFCNLQLRNSDWIVGVWVLCTLYSFYMSVIPYDCWSMTFQFTFLATASAKQAVTALYKMELMAYKFVLLIFLLWCSEDISNVSPDWYWGK